MSILYFPNRVYKGQAPAIDRVMAKRKPQLVRTTANTTSNAFSEVITANTDWYLDSIKFTFSNAAPRNYSATVLGGVKVVQNLNDYLFIAAANTSVGNGGHQKITLSPGFYTGSELATELQTKLNANPNFLALGFTFTVVYSDLTGLFIITPNSGTMQYVQQDIHKALPDKDSIAGHLFGLTQNTGWNSTIVSDTPVWALNSSAAIIDQTAATNTQHYHDDVHTLSIDQGVLIQSNVAALTVDVEVCYEEII